MYSFGWLLIQIQIQIQKEHNTGFLESIFSEEGMRSE
jgi:hypothetical protein